MICIYLLDSTDDLRFSLLEPDLVRIGDDTVVEFEVCFNTSEVVRGMLELRRVSDLQFHRCKHFFGSCHILILVLVALFQNDID